MARQFKVWNTTQPNGEISQFYVTDITDTEFSNGIKRPSIAVFPVSTLADVERQRERAAWFCEFANGNAVFTLTEKGLAYNEELLRQQLRDSELQRLDAVEHDAGALAEAANIAESVIAKVKDDVLKKKD